MRSHNTKSSPHPGRLPGKLGLPFVINISDQHEISVGGQQSNHLGPLSCRDGCHGSAHQLATLCGRAHGANAKPKIGLPHLEFI